MLFFSASWSIHTFGSILYLYANYSPAPILPDITMICTLRPHNRAVPETNVLKTMDLGARLCEQGHICNK